MQLAAKRHIQNVYNAYCKNSAYPNRSKENGIAIVNLLDKSGMQLKMGSELSTLLANLGSRMEDVSSSPASEKIREELTFEEFKMPVDGSSSCRLDYLWYDYHFNTNHFGIQKANTLYAPLREFLEEGTDVEKNYDNETIFKALRGCGNYFLSGRNGTVLRLQNGIIRTNCIDCLDRTNVVQVTLISLY